MNSSDPADPTGAAAELPLVPLDRDDPAAVATWTACTGTVFLAGEPSAAEREQRLRRTQGHRVTLAMDGEQAVATFRSFDSTVTLPGGAARPVNAVSGVTVLPTHRRRRLLTRMMTADVARAADAGAAASILIASEAGIYARFGFGPATTATTWTLHADRAAFTRPPTGTMRIVPAARWLEAAPQVYAAARRRHPGTIDRPPTYWETYAQTDPDGLNYEKKRVRALHTDAAGRVDGAVVYTVAGEDADRVPGAVLTVDDLVAGTDEAHHDLWRYLAGVDFVTTVRAADRSPGDPLPLLLADSRAARSGPVSDFLWLRVHDVPAVLAARRYPGPGVLLLDVTDPLDQVTGRYRLDVDATGAAASARLADDDATPSDTPVVSVGVADLGALLLGAGAGTTSVGTLRAAGRLTATDGAAATAAALFSWPDVAWCGTWF